jgi:hypothetical protein
VSSVSLNADLLGEPRVYQRVVGSGAGGNVVLAPVIPLGEIWVIKYAAAVHADPAARVIEWSVVDGITGFINYQTWVETLAAGFRCRVPFGQIFSGPLLLSLGGLTINAQVDACAAAINCTLEIVYHRIRGAWPLV